MFRADLGLDCCHWLSHWVEAKMDHCGRKGGRWDGRAPDLFYHRLLTERLKWYSSISLLSATMEFVCTARVSRKHTLIQIPFKYAHAVPHNLLSAAQRLTNFTLPLPLHTHASANLMYPEAQTCSLNRAANIPKSTYLTCTVQPLSVSLCLQTHARTHIGSPPSLPCTCWTTLYLGDIHSALVTNTMIRGPAEIKCCRCVRVCLVSSAPGTSGLRSHNATVGHLFLPRGNSC